MWLQSLGWEDPLEKGIMHSQKYEKSICTKLFAKALFIIAKDLETSKCPSLGDWLSKLGYTHITEQYSCENLRGISLILLWNDCQDILLSEKARCNTHRRACVHTDTYTQHTHYSIM